MDELLLAGIIAILSALPGLGLGLALLTDKWRPASLAAARDPRRARVATGRYLLMVDALVVLLGVGLIALPEVQVRPMVPYAVGIVLAGSTLGLVPLLLATRS